MVRREDWVQRLHAYIERVKETPFAWGEHDCLLFAASCVEAQTGTDLAAKFRGRYASEAMARKLLRQLGGMRNVLTAHLSDPVDPKFAQRGDVVIVDVGNGKTAAICLGTVAASAGADGVEYVNMQRALAAWKI